MIDHFSKYNNLIKQSLLDEGLNIDEINLDLNRRKICIVENEEDILSFYSIKNIKPLYVEYICLEYFWINPIYRNNFKTLFKIIKNVKDEIKKTGNKKFIIDSLSKYENLISWILKIKPYSKSKDNRFVYFYGEL